MDSLVISRVLFHCQPAVKVKNRYKSLVYVGDSKRRFIGLWFVTHTAKSKPTTGVRKPLVGLPGFVYPRFVFGVDCANPFHEEIRCHLGCALPDRACSRV